MSNEEKLKSRDGATRIVPVAGKFSNLYGRFKLQVYDNAEGVWNDLEGCYRLTWEEAERARKNYIALQDACNVANKEEIKLHVPNEGNRNK